MIFLSRLIPMVGNLAAKFAAFFFIWRWAKSDAKADRLEDENEILRDNAFLPDDTVADKLRERAKTKDRD